ncbi:hypothetical protein ABH920_007902 [Catenulispora sp. EB89]|uniref:hypothetical protein n=1 Tax=Catenulispora sp. EB89 TaxID=3156257 RepID=UPI003511B6E1
MSELEFHPLTYIAEGDGVTVGRVDNDSYVQLPADGAELLRRLSHGMRVPDAAAWYEGEYGEQLDVDDFVESMREVGFVRADGEPVAIAPTPRWQRLGRLAFGPAAWAVYAAVAAAAGWALATRPTLRPHPAQLFFVPHLIVVQLVIALLQSPAVLWHEWYHVLAARRLGLASRMSVGRRYFYVVVETSMDGLLGVPPRRRYLPMLAGILADLVLYSLLVLAAAALGQSLFGRLAVAVAYTVLLRVVWQFFIFLRTDLYFVAATALGCVDLASASRAYLRHRLHSLHWLHRLRWLRRRPQPAEADWSDDVWSPRDRRGAPVFLLLSVLGGVALVATTVLGALPVLVLFLRRAASELSGHGGVVGIGDSAASVLMLTAELVVLPLLAGWRSTRSRQE